MFNPSYKRTPKNENERKGEKTVFNKELFAWKIGHADSVQKILNVLAVDNEEDESKIWNKGFFLPQTKLKCITTIMMTFLSLKFIFCYIMSYTVSAGFNAFGFNKLSLFNESVFDLKFFYFIKTMDSAIFRV